MKHTLLPSLYPSSKLLLQKNIHKKAYNEMNINDFVSILMDIGLYSAMINAKTT